MKKIIAAVFLTFVSVGVAFAVGPDGQYPVPEPSIMQLLVIGLGGVGGYALFLRKKK